MKKKTQEALDSSRVEQFLRLFSKESPEIRQEIASTLPAYNIQLNLHASSFEEFALLPLAREKGMNVEDILFNFSDVKPVCPFCGETERIRKPPSSIYICSACKKKFTANHNSISSGTNCTSLTWLKVLWCMLEFYTVKRTCAVCNITSTTYYLIRNRLFYAMQLMLEDIRLYGNIQCDSTYVRVNFKGSDLRETEYPEDSPFDDLVFVHRPPRQRGGSYHSSELNENYIGIFTAMDDRGHVLCRYTGLGISSVRGLRINVKEDKFLLEVPSKDPFSLFVDKKKESSSTTGDASLLIADGDRVLKRFAEGMGINFESHVYRRNGKQVRLPASAHNIQLINNLHKRLKDFLRKTNYVSSKYLPGYLLLFEFIENTGASIEAIGKLFEILATPGLGKGPDFYKELFSVPNYMIQALTKDKPLKGYTDSQLLAVFLYSQRAKDLKKNIDTIQVKTIEEETGYSSSYIRQLYKKFAVSGLLKLVEEHFEPKKKKEKGSKSRSQKDPFISIIPAYLSIYDEFRVWRTTSGYERPKIQDFIANMNEKYNLSLKRPTFYHYMNRIEELGLREPLPELTERRKRVSESHTEDILNRFEEIENSYRRRGLKPPLSKEIASQIASEFNVAASTIMEHVAAGRNERKNRLILQEKEKES